MKLVRPVVNGERSHIMVWCDPSDSEHGADLIHRIHEPRRLNAEIDARFDRHDLGATAVATALVVSIALELIAFGALIYTWVTR